MFWWKLLVPCGGTANYNNSTSHDENNPVNKSKNIQRKHSNNPKKIVKLCRKLIQGKMVELNKSAFHTEEFHCLDFLLLGARNELCNLYLYCIILLQFY